MALLFFLSILVVLSQGQTSYSSVKQGTILNALNTIRQFTVDFGQELFVVEANSCPDFSSTSPILCEQTCNYASSTACGSSTTTGCTCGLTSSICNADQYTELTVGGSVRILQTQSIQQFRVFLPAYRPYRIAFRGNNLGSIVAASTSHGIPLTLTDVISVENPHWVRDMMFTSKPTLHLCPSDASFSPGTWYIHSACWGPYACDYAVYVDELPLLAAPATGTCASNSAPSGYTCVEAHQEMVQLYPDNQNPLWLVYYPPAGACPNLFGFSAKTHVHSYLRAQLSLTDLNDPSAIPFYDSQTEIGSIWTAHSFACGAGPIYMKLTFDWTEDPTVPVTIFVSSSPNGFLQRSVGEMFAVEYSFLTSAASYLECPGVNLTECNSRKLTIAYDYNVQPNDLSVGTNVDYKDFSCSRAVNHPQPASTNDNNNMPVDVTNPFWPPFGVSNFVSNGRQVEVYPSFDIGSTKHEFVVLMDSTTSSQQTVYYNSSQVNDNCTLHFTGVLTFANFAALPDTVPNGPRPVLAATTIGECDLDAINEIATLLASYRASAVSPRASVTIGELFTTAFLADSVAFSDQWVFCFNWLNDHLNDATPFTIEEDVPDYLQLYPTIEHISLSANSYTLDGPNSEQALADCDVACASSFMEELNIYKAADKCPAFNQTLDEFLINGMSFIEKCVQTTYHPTHGDMRSALDCQLDGQCLEGRCNTFTHTCVVEDMSVYNSEVLACLVAKAPSFLLGQMFPGFYDLSDTAQAQLLSDTFTQPGCAPVNDWNADFYDAYRMGMWCDDECGGTTDSPVAFTPYPLQLSDICKRSSCSLDIKLNAYQNVECDAVACSDKRLSVADCATAAPFCGLCEGPSDCRQYYGVGSADPTTCQNTQICIAHDGSIIDDLAGGVCSEDFGACYIDSPKGFGQLTQFPVTNRNDCIQVSLQMELVWYAGLPGYSGQGLCYFPQVPPAIPCNRYNGIPISSGCIILDMNNQTQCEAFLADTPTWYEGTENRTVGMALGDSFGYQVLSPYHATWIPASGFAGTSNTFQCVIDFYDVNGLETSWAFPKNSTDCAAAGGKFVRTFKTLGTEWIPGVLRTGQWVKPSVQKLANPATIFSYQAFNSAVQTTLSQLYFVDQSAPSICRLESPISSLSSLLLQCRADCVAEDTKNVNCPISEQIYLSRATLCSGLQKSFTAYPLAVTALESSLPLGTCNELSVFLIPRSHFAYIVVPVFTSPFYIDPKVGDYQYPYVSVNYHNAVIGNVVSDGIYFTATTFATNISTTEIPSVQLCVTPTYSSSYQDPDFPGTYYFAVLAPEPINTIQPLTYNLSASNSTSTTGGGNGTAYCAFIDLQVGDTYFLVHVQHPWWETEVIDYMNTGQEVYFLLIGAFYFLLFLPFAYFTFKYREQFTFYIYFSVSTCLLWRSIHLLVVGGSRGTISSPFLSEPPFFFYFYVLACYGVFYYVLWKHAMDKKKFAMTFRVLALVVAFFLFSICIVVCVVATTETVHSPLDSRFFTCYLRIDNGDIYWTSPQIISVAYFCLLLVLALIISAWKMYNTVSLSNKLHGKTKLNSREKAGNQFIMAAFILSIAMVIQAILILTLGLIAGTRGILWLRLTTLYFFELTPLLFLLWKVIFAPAGSGSTTSRGATGSKKTGGASQSGDSTTK